MQLLRSALCGESVVALDSAALEMAAIERPRSDPARYLKMLDDIATEVDARLGGGADGRKFVQAMNEHLFQQLGFRGNEAEYYDPSNSCLDSVLDRRTGIPITLSVVCIEVARRLRRPMFGVGLPGHFVVQYDDGEYFTYIDPFHGGRLLSEKDCRQLASDIAGVEVASDPSALAPVSNRYILVRMLNNLRSSYFRAKQYLKAAAVMDLLVEAFPRNSEYFKARAIARLHLKQFGPSKSDFEKYLQLSPDAEDRTQVRDQLEAIHRMLGRLN